MSYSDFSINDIKARFGLRLEESRDLYAAVAPVEIGPLLRETLAENVPLALAISTEKARSRTHESAPHSKNCPITSTSARTSASKSVWL